MGKTLKNGGTQSCGCLNKELMYKIKPKISENNYIFKENYIILEVLDENRNKYESFIDCNNYEIVKKYLWWLCGSGYLISQDQDNIIFLHKLILYGDQYNTSFEGDHIDGNKLNNREDNLRKVTHQLNMYNNKIFKNNTSGTTGVWFNKRNNKWCAEINYEKKKHYLGEYNNKEDAIFIREITELKLFKEHSRRYNELKEKYKDIEIKKYNNIS